MRLAWRAAWAGAALLLLGWAVQGTERRRVRRAFYDEHVAGKAWIEADRAPSPPASPEWEAASREGYELENTRRGKEALTTFEQFLDSGSGYPNERMAALLRHVQACQRWNLPFRRDVLEELVRACPEPYRWELLSLNLRAVRLDESEAFLHGVLRDPRSTARDHQAAVLGLAEVLARRGRGREAVARAINARDSLQMPMDFRCNFGPEDVHKFIETEIQRIAALGGAEYTPETDATRILRRMYGPNTAETALLVFLSILCAITAGGRAVWVRLTSAWRATCRPSWLWLPCVSLYVLMAVLFALSYRVPGLADLAEKHEEVVGLPFLPLLPLLAGVAGHYSGSGAVWDAAWISWFGIASMAHMGCLIMILLGLAGAGKKSERFSGSARATRPRGRRGRPSGPSARPARP